MKITINGKEKIIDESTSNLNLTKLIKSLDYNPLLIVIEFNGEILNRSYWDNTIICDGDTLEIVTIVGGGS